jgi:hypothetical protein
MKNITVTLDDETASWVRQQAARDGVSVSRMLGSLLLARSRELAAYDIAMRKFLNRQPTALRRNNEPYPTRETLHERTHL